jgi:phosphinothricin acetyltransferase
MARRIGWISATHPWLVLERAGAVVGYAYGCPHRSRAAYRWAADVSVYVGARHHRSGAGRELYSALLGLLREQRFRTACAGITLPNEASVGLHEALGFTLVGVYRDIGWKAGAWRDVGWWQRPLHDPGPGPPPDPPPDPLPPRRLIAPA